MKKYIRKEVIEFLDESNRIEGVYDADSLEQAEKAWDFLAEQEVLTPYVILKTHELLMAHSMLSPSEKGNFRRAPVWIGGKEAMEYTQIPDAIEDLIKDIEVSLNYPGKDGENIKIDHITFEEIHPFIDGNGRVGRMLMNWERMMAGLPILIIKAGGKEQVDYYKWFRKHD